MNTWQRSIALVLLTIAGCSGNPAAPGTPPATPAWVTALIHQLETAPVANPPASVTRYDYKGQEVYFVPESCCDMMSDLYNSYGAIMCHPNGGFSGKGDGKCADFYDARRNEHVIWQDPRH